MMDAVRSPSPGAGAVAIAVMAKAPRAGLVKTRLCPPLDPAEAAELYRCFLLDRVAQVSALDDVTPVLAYAPPDAREELAALAPGVALLPQRGPDLGERLTHVFADLLGEHGAAIATDSDTPTLPRRCLDGAVRALTDGGADVALGPTEDGGYYLIGLRRPTPSLFQGIRWSTPEVLDATMDRARQLGLRVELLPRWFDVDTPADLERLRATLLATGGDEPRHTRRLLAGRARS
jgi:rSAM/selenodomain-associated transferase 1